MLEIEEHKRLSTLKLALICQIDKQFLSRIIIPYPKIFRPKLVKVEFGNNICKINYCIKTMCYEGTKNYLKMGNINKNLIYYFQEPLLLKETKS